mmetsp:Transcript_67688/g.218657  ORF Transcript_67688/g.218657 Transcript_67688/m.218657 type:complete len:235 (+) Transcript_67688:875-1579(+)
MARIALMSPGSRHIGRTAASSSGACSGPSASAASPGGPVLADVESFGAAAASGWAAGSASCGACACSAALASAARLASAWSSRSKSCCRWSIRFSERILSNMARSTGVSGICDRTTCVRGSSSPRATRTAMSFGAEAPQSLPRSRPGSWRSASGNAWEIEMHSPRRGSKTRWCQNTATTFWNRERYSSFVQVNFSFHLLSCCIQLIIDSTFWKLHRYLKAVFIPKPLMWTSCSL